MLRPTPIRLLYLIVGVIVGAIVFYGFVSVAGGAPKLFTVPGTARPTPVPAAAQFSGAQLNQVVTANQVISKNGVTIRVNALERYADGFSLTYDILGTEPAVVPSTLQPDRLVVTDDRGTNYQVSRIGSAEATGPGLTAGYVAFTPALPTDAATLRISVPHVLVTSNDFESGTPRVVDGPWDLQVPLK